MGITHRHSLPAATLLAALLTVLACAPATQSSPSTTAAAVVAAARPSGPVRHRYRYSAVIDRRYDLSSVGQSGTRELQALADWTVSVTLEPIAADSLRVQATVDSADLRLTKKIPEIELGLPPTLGQGGHVEGTVARHSGTAGLRAVTPTDSLLLSVLPLVVPELAPVSSEVAGGDAAADTTYAAQRARRVAMASPTGLPDLVELIVKFRSNSGDFELNGENLSNVQGTHTQYFDKQGTLLGVRVDRRMTTATDVSAQGMGVTIAGDGTEAVRVDRLP